MLCCAGVALAQTEWVEHPDNPVLGPGEPGAWDELGHAAFTVLLVDSTYHMWFGGWDGNGTNSDIGHATSSDGVEWIMDPANPVLIRGGSESWDDELLSVAAVTYDGAQFQMWYGGGDGTLQRVGYATSTDGTTWTKYADNPVIDVGPQGSWTDSIVRPGSVIFEGDVYRMWFFGFGTGGVYRIGHGMSSNGIQWSIDSDPVLEPSTAAGAWDSPAVANPFVAFDGSNFHMWYPAGIDGWPPSGHIAVGYAFSTDGFNWTKHRYNPVVQTADNYVFLAPALFDGSAWHMWYSHTDGSIRWIEYATSECCPVVPALDHTQYIPAAAYAAGAEGSFYETDLDLSNAGDQAVDYQLQWLPRGQSNSEPTTSAIFTLGAGKSVRYANVLAEVFDLEPDSFGALSLLSTSDDLLAMARIANTPQEVARAASARRFRRCPIDEFTGMHERRRLLFGTEHADMRYNVGCMNAATTPARVNFELFRSDGTLLGTESLLLMPFDNNQLNRIFDDYHPVTGAVDFWSAVLPGRIYCYGLGARQRDLGPDDDPAAVANRGPRPRLHRIRRTRASLGRPRSGSAVAAQRKPASTMPAQPGVRYRDRHKTRGKRAPTGCRVRHCAGTTIRFRPAPRTMALPGSLGRPDVVCCPGYEAGRRRPRSAWSQPSQSTHARPRRWCDAGSPGRQCVLADQKAGDDRIPSPYPSPSPHPRPNRNRNRRPVRRR